MASARRKTTIEERKEIVKYCIEHNRDYKRTASNYDVSYNQVYSWVKKYDVNGDERKIDTFAEMPMYTGIEPVFTGTKIVVPEKKEIEKGQFQMYNIVEDRIINNI